VSDVRLNLCGDYIDSHTRESCHASAGWSRVNYLGYLDRTGVQKALQRSVAGLVTLQPLRNYIEAMPIKLFEYMAAGLPVIASDFPLWKDIVIGNKCGICVNPTRPEEIAAAIEHLIRDRSAARRMGQNGRDAVETKYNWKVEEARLLKFYKGVIA
jgi:glycosyltransferase involved in cell wall biosynthesis